MSVYLTEHTLLADRYRISHLLGQGGMGAVYLAADLRFRSTPVAVKQRLVGANREDLRKAFEREAMLLNHLRHAALPRVTDFFVDGDSQFLVMEYVAGTDLHEELERHGMPLPLKSVVLWADQLLGALSYLHAQTPPVIHRDIKPQNVRLTPKGDVMLLDFGLSKGSVGEYLTAGSSVVAGTPNYASPEQMGGQGTDERADLFSLAATIYCLLTATPPPDAARRLMDFVNGLEDPIRPLHTVNPAVPEPLSAAIHRALSLRPGDRQSSAVELREDIRRTVDAVEVALPPVEACGPADSSIATDDVPRDVTQLETPSDVKGSTVVEGTFVAHPHTAVAPRSSALDDQDVATTTKLRGPGDVWAHRGFVLLVVTLLVVAVYQCSNLGTQPKPAQQRASTQPRAATPPVEVPPERSMLVEIGNGVKVAMVLVPAGTFAMGEDKGGTDYPMHRVTISKPFWLGKYEVTHKQWAAVMGSYPSEFDGNVERPANEVSWADCQAFIRKLNALTRMHFRLPTEAEWEYACRAGTSDAFAGELSQIAWTRENTALSGQVLPLPVGLKKPNSWGLHDMHGNVWEWCEDRYDENYYQRSPERDPPGPANGPARVLRGGCWLSFQQYCGSAYRYSLPPTDRVPIVGFRLVRTL